MCSDSVSLSSISTAWWGTRHFVTLMLFMGMANAYVMRTNMSVAIVAMAKHTGTDDEDSPSSNECPDRIDQIVSTLALGGLWVVFVRQPDWDARSCVRTQLRRELCIACAVQTKPVLWANGGNA